jgi:Cu(I)/Ag(I) efflux system membrane fusion protein
MKLKHWIASTLMMLAIGIAAIGVTGCNSEPKTGSNSGGTQAHQYTCAMHPEVVQSSPGKCPKCGMELTEKK